MYEKLNITENHLNVLSLFAKGFNKEYYIREIQRILKISPRTAQLILDSLEQKSILKSNLRGKIKNYSLEQNFIAKKYLLLTETHKEIIFLENNSIIKEIISQIIPHINGIALIFGSQVKNIQKKNSDIDLFVIGKCNQEEIEDIAETYNLEIDIKNYTKKEFSKNIHQDYLIKEVLENHIIIKNKEEFLDLIWKI